MTTGGRPGAPLGNAKVGIAKTSTSGEELTSMKPEDMEKMAKTQMDSPRPPETKSEIPGKFGNPENSGLVATLDIEASKNVFEYRLSD